MTHSNHTATLTPRAVQLRIQQRGRPTPSQNARQWLTTCGNNPYGPACPQFGTKRPWVQIPPPRQETAGQRPCVTTFRSTSRPVQLRSTAAATRAPQRGPARSPQRMPTCLPQPTAIDLERAATSVPRGPRMHVKVQQRVTGSCGRRQTRNVPKPQLRRIATQSIGVASTNSLTVAVPTIEGDCLKNGVTGRHAELCLAGRISCDRDDRAHGGSD